MRKPIQVATIDALTPAMFSHSETGKIRGGIKWTTATDHVAMECYQFDTLEELQACAREYQSLPVMLTLSIVTHAGQYKDMRTLYEWRR